jgi:hypothetical protein
VLTALRDEFVWKSVPRDDFWRESLLWRGMYRGRSAASHGAL